MANTYKNIIITPNRDTVANVVPTIQFSGGDATLNTDINLRVYTTSSGTLSFEGSAGQLFSITNDLTNSIFSVNDVSGIPSIDVFANGNIFLAPYSGNVRIGSTVAPTSKLHVTGDANVSTTLRVGGNVSFDNIDSVRLWEPTANVLTISTASTERMRIDATGNVLIGRADSTVGQDVKLDVNGAINTSAILVNGSTLTSATQAQQEANTSTAVYVSPAVQQFHKSAAKVWGSFLANSTTIQEAYNVSSLADTATGQLTVNFGVTFSATTFAVLVGIEQTSTTSAYSVAYGNKATTSVRLYSVVEGGSGADSTSWSVAIFGDLV